MGLQVGKDVFGVARQSGKGALAANPTFAHGLTGGGIKVDISQEADPITSAYLSPAGAYRDKIEAGAQVETRVWQKAIGLYLLGALGSDVVTGTGPYTHTITLGSSTPYLSLFEKKGDGSLHALRDAKVDELEISWEENKPLDLKVTTVAGVWSVPSTFTPAVDESDTANYYVPVGGTFKYAVDSGTPAVAAIVGGKITIKRSAEAVFKSGTIEADDVQEGGCSVELSLTVLPDDMALWKNVVTGSPTGTSIQTTPLYGSAEVAFTKGADSLKLAAGSVAFLCDMPDADPAGGSAKVELVGTAYRGAAASPITATLINTQATY
jgi:hypothetical protein